MVRLRRWKITLHRIRPQTSAPVASAATQEPCQSARIRGCLLRWPDWACRGGDSPCTSSRWPSPGPGPRPAPAAASPTAPRHRAAADAFGRGEVGAVGTHVAPSRESRPRVRVFRPSAGRSARARALGVDVYADQTLLDATSGSRGEGVQRAGPHPEGMAGLRSPGPADSVLTPRPAGVVACPRVLFRRWRPPLRCTPRRVRRCWPRSTRGGPTRPGCTARARRARVLLDARARGRRGRCRLPPRRDWSSPLRVPRRSISACRGLPPDGAGPAGIWWCARSSTPRAARRRAARARRRQVTTVGVDRTGRVDPAEFAAALRPDTALACLQSANHEVGTVQPVAEVAEACRAAGCRCSSTPRSRAGRCRSPAAGRCWPASAHKWGGPPGVGRPRRPQGHPVALAGARGRAGGPAGARLRERARRSSPPPPRCAAVRAPRRRRTARGCPRWSTGSGTRVPQLVPDVEVVGDDRPTGCPTWSPSPASTSTARRC